MNHHIQNPMSEARSHSTRYPRRGRRHLAAALAAGFLSVALASCSQSGGSDATSKEVSRDPVDTATPVEDPTVEWSFEDGPDRWTIVGDASEDTSETGYLEEGGNPDGHVTATDQVTGGTYYFSAPDSLLADIGPDPDGGISWDQKTSELGSPYDAYDVLITGDGVTLVAMADGKMEEDEWIGRSVPFAAGRWLVADSEAPDPEVDLSTLEVATQEEIDAVLSDLEVLMIRGEFNDGSDEGSLDNVRIS